MVNETPTVACYRQGPVESCLTRLVMEAQRLHLHCHKLAMLCLAVGSAPDEAAEIAAEIDAARAALSSTLTKLRNSRSYFLRSYDHTLADMMDRAFADGVAETFERFDQHVGALAD